MGRDWFRHWLVRKRAITQARGFPRRRRLKRAKARAPTARFRLRLEGDPNILWLIRHLPHLLGFIIHFVSGGE